MGQLHITGGIVPHGTVKVSGNKNAALPMLAASLLTRETVTIRNMPDILDVRTMMDIIRALGGKVEFENNTAVIDPAGIASGVIPKELCANAIVRYVRAMKGQTGAALTVHSIADGQAEAIEFLVDESTLHRGEPLRNLKLKKNVLVASIAKGIRTEIPNGDSVFEKGDTVIIVTNGDEVIYQLNDIFRA